MKGVGFGDGEKDIYILPLIMLLHGTFGRQQAELTFILADTGVICRRFHGV